MSEMSLIFSLCCFVTSCYGEMWFVVFLQALFGVSYAIMADAFSSSSETVIQRAVDVTVKTNTPLEKLEELYQIKKTCDFINERQFEKVSSILTFNHVNSL